MIWSSNSFGSSHAAACCWFMKPTTTSPFGSTAPYEKKLSSQAPAGPAGKSRTLAEDSRYGLHGDRAGQRPPGLGDLT